MFLLGDPNDQAVGVGREWDPAPRRVHFLMFVLGNNQSSPWGRVRAQNGKASIFQMPCFCFLFTKVKYAMCTNTKQTNKQKKQKQRRKQDLPSIPKTKRRIPLRTFFFFGFLGQHPQHMEVPRLGVESEL